MWGPLSSIPHKSSSPALVHVPGLQTSSVADCCRSFACNPIALRLARHCAELSEILQQRLPRQTRGETPVMSRYRVGRLLQVLGMIILPFGIASELVGKVGLGQSMLIAAAGTLIFYVGYVLQNSS